MRQLDRRVLCIAAAGLTITALVLWGNSPLSNWVAGLPTLTNIVSVINLPTVLFALAGFPGKAAPPEGFVLLVAALQWLIYGYTIAFAWRKIGHHFQSKRAT